MYSEVKRLGAIFIKNVFVHTYICVCSNENKRKRGYELRVVEYKRGLSESTWKRLKGEKEGRKVL